MVITFDEIKRRSNIVKHRRDFAELDMEFFDRALVLSAKQGRMLAIGRFEDTIVTVVFKPLGAEALSVISMRNASYKERKLLWQN